MRHMVARQQNRIVSHILVFDFVWPFIACFTVSRDVYVLAFRSFCLTGDFGKALQHASKAAGAFPGGTGWCVWCISYIFLLCRRNHAILRDRFVQIDARIKPECWGAGGSCFGAASGVSKSGCIGRRWFCASYIGSSHSHRSSADSSPGLDK